MVRGQVALALLDEVGKGISGSSRPACPGASGRIKATWLDRGFDGESYNILQDPSHDLAAKEGFVNLLLLGLRLTERAIVVAGPPRSCFVFLSSSSQGWTYRSLVETWSEAIEFDTQ